MARVKKSVDTSAYYSAQKDKEAIAKKNEVKKSVDTSAYYSAQKDKEAIAKKNEVKKSTSNSGTNKYKADQSAYYSAQNDKKAMAEAERKVRLEAYETMREGLKNANAELTTVGLDLLDAMERIGNSFSGEKAQTLWNGFKNLIGEINDIGNIINESEKNANKKIKENGGTPDNTANGSYKAIEPYQSRINTGVYRCDIEGIGQTLPLMDDAEKRIENAKEIIKGLPKGLDGCDTTVVESKVDDAKKNANNSKKSVENEKEVAEKTEAKNKNLLEGIGDFFSDAWDWVTDKYDKAADAVGDFFGEAFGNEKDDNKKGTYVNLDAWNEINQKVKEEVGIKETKDNPLTSNVEKDPWKAKQDDELAKELWGNLADRNGVDTNGKTKEEIEYDTSVVLLAKELEIDTNGKSTTDLLYEMAEKSNTELVKKVMEKHNTESAIKDWLVDNGRGRNYNSPDCDFETWYYDLSNPYSGRINGVATLLMNTYDFKDVKIETREDGVHIASGTKPNGEKFENLVVVAAYSKGKGYSDGIFERGTEVMTSMGPGIILDWCEDAKKEYRQDGTIHFDIATTWHLEPYTSMTLDGTIPVFEWEQEGVTGKTEKEIFDELLEKYSGTQVADLIGALQGNTNDSTKNYFDKSSSESNKNKNTSNSVFGSIAPETLNFQEKDNNEGKDEQNSDDSSADKTPFGALFEQYKDSKNALKLWNFGYSWENKETTEKLLKIIAENNGIDTNGMSSKEILEETSVILIAKEKGIDTYGKTKSELVEELAKEFDVELKTESTYSENGKFKEVPLFNQLDFAYVKFGDGNIRSGGCGPTSLCMLWSAATGEIHTPEELMKEHPEYGNYYKLGEGCSDSLMQNEEALAEMNLQLEGNYYWGEAWGEGKLVEALKNGYTAIWRTKNQNFTKSGHYLVITGITEDGKILVNDPNGANYMSNNPVLVDGFANGFDPEQFSTYGGNFYIYSVKDENIITETTNKDESKIVEEIINKAEGTDSGKLIVKIQEDLDGKHNVESTNKNGNSELDTNSTTDDIPNLKPKNNSDIAHRGFTPGGIWDNSAEGFKLAGEKGFWGCEADVRFDKNGNLVCSHNAVKNGENPTSFEEYLDICKEYGMTAIIDLKYEKGVGPADEYLSPEILKTIQEKGMLDSCILQTNNPIDIPYIRENSNEARIWYLTDVISDENVELIKENNVECVNILSGENNTNAYRIKKLTENEIDVCFWNVQSDELKERLLDAGAKYVMSDNVLGITPYQEGEEDFNSINI